MPAQDPWHEGQDGSHPTYREWLYPPVVIIFIVVALTGIVGVAYGAAYGSRLGWGSGLVLTALALIALAATSTPLRVDDRVVRAGRARLPLSAISAAVALDGEQMRQARRFGDPRDYVVLRAWSSSRGVEIAVGDPHDPHPRWLVTTRHPERFVAAIDAAVAQRSSS